MLKFQFAIKRLTHRPRQRAQAMVEFALILPLLLLLVVAIIDLGRALFVYSQVSNAAREAVRYGTVDAINCGEVENRARSMFTIVPSGAVNVSVALETPSGSDFVSKATCSSGGTLVGGKPARGDRIRVNVSTSIEPISLQLFSPFFGGTYPAFPITYSASRSVIPPEGISTGPTSTPRPTKTIPAGPPPDPQPTNFQLTCTGLNVSATWSGTATSFRIYNSADVAVWSGAASPATNFTTVASGALTTFSIVSVNSVGTESEPVSASVTCISNPPGPVSSFSLSTDCAHTQNNDVIVTWTAPGSGGTVDHYVIYAAPSNPNAPWNSGNLAANLTSHTINNVIDQGDVLGFYIIAYNSAGEAGPAVSASVACNAVIPPPPPPAAFALSCNSLAVSASWIQPVVGLSYRIYRSSDNALVWSGTGSSATGFATVAAAGLTPGYYIVSVEGTLESTRVDAAPVTCLPLPPSNFQLSCNDLNVTANWTAPAGSGLSYRIYRTSDNASVWSGGGSPATDFTTVQNGIPAGFALVTIQNGLESNRVSANITCTPIVPPTNFSVSCSGAAVAALWVEPIPNTGRTYRIYQGAGATPLWEGTGSSALFTPTLPVANSVFRISSVFSGIESAKAASAPLTCGTVTVPPAPTNFVATCNNLQVSGTWTEPITNTGLTYRIYTTTTDLTPVWSSVTAVSSAINFTTLPAATPTTFYLVSVLNGIESTPRLPSNPVTCTAPPPAITCAVSWANNSYPAAKNTTFNDEMFMAAKILCSDGTYITNATVYPVSDGGVTYTNYPLVPITTQGYYGDTPNSCRKMPTTYSTNLRMGLVATYTLNNVTVQVTQVPVPVVVSNSCPPIP